MYKYLEDIDTTWKETEETVEDRKIPRSCVVRVDELHAKDGYKI